jgi:Holliday junction resolvase
VVLTGGATYVIRVRIRAMTPEGYVKKEVRRVLDTIGGDVWYFMPVSNGMGAHGIPDFIGCCRGVMFGIEAKAVGGKPTRLQTIQMDKIRRSGGEAIVVVGVSEAKALAEHPLFRGRGE